MVVRVLFEGTLDKCTFEHGKKDWKRRHFVFKHILASNIRSLEFYGIGTKNWKKTEPKGVLALYPGYEILKVHEPKKHFVFEIKTVDHTYRLAAHSEEELNQWILVLERESIVNSFFVEPEANEQMAKVGATDACHLHIANSELRLLCAKDGRLLLAWPFTCLRRYMSTRGKFTVEAGRRAPTGEGKFTFLTPQHDEIYKLMDSVVRSRASNKAGGTSTSYEIPQNTKSVPCNNTPLIVKDESHNGYDQLKATSSVTDPYMSPSSSNSMKNAYATPYGHLPTRDAVKTCPPHMGKVSSQVTAAENRSSAEFDEGEQYHTLSHPGSEKHLQQHYPKNVSDDEYCTLTQHLLPTSDRQDMYNVLHHSGSSQPITGLQHQNQDAEDVYNVLGEAVQSMISSGIQSGTEENTYNTLDVKSSSQGLMSASILQGEEMYNTLDHATAALSSHKPIHPPSRTDSHGQPVLRTPPKPLARKPSGELIQSKASNSTSVAEDDNMYNTLDTKARPPSHPVRKAAEQRTAFQKSKSISLDEGDSDSYNTLETRRPPPPPPPYQKTSEQMMKLQKPHPVPVGESNNMYNTLDMTKVGHSPVSVRGNLFKTSTNEGGETYNTLNAATRVGATQTPVPRLSDQDLKTDEIYNTLNATRVGPTANPIHSERKDDVVSDLSTDGDLDNMYNTLDKSRMGLSTSVPAPLLRSFSNHNSNPNSPLSPVKKDSPSLKSSSTSGLQSECCPLDVSESLQENPKRSSSLDNLDSYASIDFSTTLRRKAGCKQSIPVPAQRALNAKGLASMTRKASAPDILSVGTTKSGKDIKKGGKSNLVLNLKASLEAGGLDFSKPRRKPKKLSRGDSEELPTYAEIEEHGVTPPSAEDVFTPGTPPVRTGACSSPVESRQGEDIYDELDQSAPRPKSLQITKTKKSPKK